jgi:gamma-glutamyltranspeptidase
VAAVPPDPPRLRQPKLAQTLRAIAADGADAFYRGDVAVLIARAFERNGGLLSRADLEAYRAAVERPLRGSYRGWSVLAPCAPSGGGTVIRALELLGRTPSAGVGELADSLRAAFAERYRLAGDTAADAGHGTTHLCAIDAEGRIVSCPSTGRGRAPGKAPLTGISPRAVPSAGERKFDGTS